MIVERGSRHIGFWDEKEGAIAQSVITQIDPNGSGTGGGTD
jgi:hypothetical protein